MFEQIIDQVNKSNSIIIFPHTNMDGDSVGSAKALCLALNKLGKKAFVLADENVPEHVGFLDGKEFIVYDKQEFEYDLAFAVDCSDNQRIENRFDVWEKAKTKVCLDHHPGNDDFADYIYRDVDASAAAVIVYRFIKELNVELDKDIAESIYTGILLDTGCFKYSNTNTETHLVVADLYNYNIEHDKICSLAYENKDIRQLTIESYAIDHVQLFFDNRLAISVIPYVYWNALGAKYEYVDTAIEAIRNIRGVEIAVVLKEKENDLFKISFRSKTDMDVSDIAAKLGGGGHKKAAACTLEMPLEEAYNLVCNELMAKFS